jgi:hypothetical protein
MADARSEPSGKATFGLLQLTYVALMDHWIGWAEHMDCELPNCCWAEPDCRQLLLLGHWGLAKILVGS